MVGTLSTPVAVVFTASLVLAFIDLWKKKIYNLFTYPLLISGFVYHGVVGGMPGLLDSLLGCLLGFAILIPFFALGGMGGGDVKLMAAIGAWLGLLLTFAIFITSSLITGLYALILVISYGRMREVWCNVQILWTRFTAMGRYLSSDDQIESEVMQPDRGRRVIPFAPMLVLGMFVLVVAVRYFADIGR